MTDLILMGGGGHCQSVIDVIEAEGSHRIMGVLEDPAFEGSDVMGYPILGTDDALADLVGQALVCWSRLGKLKRRRSESAPLRRKKRALPYL